MMKTKTKLKQKNKKTIENENENGNAKTAKLVTQQYGAYGCYGRMALNLWLTVEGI